MIKVFDCEQGSPEWFACRLGIPTASEFHSVMAKGRDGKKDGSTSKTRRTYMMRLIGERITGEPAETYTNGHMERGRLMEDEARRCYAFMTDEEPVPVGFIRHAEVGCSPDSIIGDAGLLEIKTRLPHLQIETLLAGEMPPEHRHQVQGQLWVSGRAWCDFVSYWPKLPLFVKRIHRDEDYIKEIAREVSAFLGELRAFEFHIRQMDGTASVGAALSASLAEPATILGAA